MVGFPKPADRGRPIEKLTPRELEIVLLVAQHFSNPDIGKALGITVQTVKNHLRWIYDKTGMTSRQELICKFCPEKVGRV